MQNTQNSLIEKLCLATLDLNRDKVKELVEIALDEGIDLSDLVNEGLTVGLRKLGERFEREEIFLPELILGAEIVQENMKELESHMSRKSIDKKEKLLIGTVSGDLHDVGKNIVCAVFSAAGYDVIDLGIDVNAETFIECVRKECPDCIGLSSLLTTTMREQRTIIASLEEAGLRDSLKIIIGGAPTSESWAKEIGADAYAEDCFAGLKRVNEFFD